MRPLALLAALVATALVLVAGCDASDSSVPPGGTCGRAVYPGWQTSDYALPYPIGEAVVAVRAGRVHKTEARYADTDHDWDHANGVIVDHGGGVFSRYLHFTQGGVAVGVDDRVEAGDTLGYSGNSGFSTQPHLHLDVLTDCIDGACRSVPITFRNAGENMHGLVQGRTYTAHP